MGAYGKLVVFLGLLTLGISIVLFVWGFQIYQLSGQTILDMQFTGRTPAMVEQVLSAYQGNESVAIYRKVQLLDILYPLAYGSFGALWLYILFKPSAWRFLCTLPIVSAIADTAENNLLREIVAGYPELSADMIARSSVYTQVKYGAIALALVALAGGLIRRANAHPSRPGLRPPQDEE